MFKYKILNFSKIETRWLSASLEGLNISRALLLGDYSRICPKHAPELNKVTYSLKFYTEALTNSFEFNCRKSLKSLNHFTQLSPVNNQSLMDCFWLIFGYCWFRMLGYIADNPTRLFFFKYDFSFVWVGNKHVTSLGHQEPRRVSWTEDF